MLLSSECQRMQERRMGIGPVPPSPKDFVTSQQASRLFDLRRSGWQLICIRRHDPDRPEIILGNQSESQTGILSADGSLRVSSRIKLRKKGIPKDQGMASATLSLFQHYRYSELS